jgi:1,4-alpha-glucan branching enzyme
MQQKPTGYLCLMLHAHLPWVRHPECDYFLEENWLFEAITDSYIPLLEMLDRLSKDQVPFRLTLSLSPTLCSMLADPLLRKRYLRRINLLIDLAGKELTRTKSTSVFFDSAQRYQSHFKKCRDIFSKKGTLLENFKKFQDAGMLEIITTSATHAYLPAFQNSPEAVRAQIKTGIDTFKSFFGSKPAGFWLPECGYFPGVESFLEQNGIRYFFTDTHGILYAQPKPTYSAYAPIVCRESGIAVFGRDQESSKAVWNPKEGYPADPVYRDFYRDIGFDLDMNYIGPYIDPIGLRTSTGFKYYRVTGKSTHKEPYAFDKALARAQEHAQRFVADRSRQAAYLASLMDRPPLITAPYDAELFGHWWYEGPVWLEAVIRLLSKNPAIQLITPSDYLSLHPRNQACAPSFSSWGMHGYSEAWIDPSNDWIYRHIHRMQRRMTECARAYPGATGMRRRALNQMARELMLSESSDWPFIMKTGTTVQYATRRVKDHIANFLKLHAQIIDNSISPEFVSHLEKHNNIFHTIDYSTYS